MTVYKQVCGNYVEILTVYRKPGQGGDADHHVRDLRAELLQAEAAHFAKTKGGASQVTETTEVPTSNPKRQLENGLDSDGEEDPEAKRRRILEETRDIDADSDDEKEDDSSEDDRLVVLEVVKKNLKH